MMRHDDTARLRHMLAHASEAVELASGRTHADELFGLAMTRAGWRSSASWQVEKGRSPINESNHAGEAEVQHDATFRRRATIMPRWRGSLRPGSAGRWPRLSPSRAAVE